MPAFLTCRSEPCKRAGARRECDAHPQCIATSFLSGTNGSRRLLRVTTPHECLSCQSDCGPATPENPFAPARTAPLLAHREQARADAAGRRAVRAVAAAGARGVGFGPADGADGHHAAAGPAANPRSAELELA